MKSSKTQATTGSATIEYIIVSTFAAVLSLAGISYVGKLVHQKVDKLAEKTGVSADELDIDIGYEP
jgi:Flp pilus assembly pilin Flp